MTGLFNPDQWWEGLLLAFLGICPVLAVVLPLVIQRSYGKQLGEIKDQVSNDHSTNLRDDIDDLMSVLRQTVESVADLKVDVRDVRQDIVGIREDLRDERKERIAGDRLRIETQSINSNP